MSHTAAAAPDAATDSPTRVISVAPVVLPAPGRGDDLQVRVSAPATGDALASIVFSHGFGSSMDNRLQRKSATNDEADEWTLASIIEYNSMH